MKTEDQNITSMRDNLVGWRLELQKTDFSTASLCACNVHETLVMCKNYDIMYMNEA